MAEQAKRQTALGDEAERQLAIATRTVPQMITITHYPQPAKRFGVF